MITLLTVCMRISVDPFSKSTNSFSLSCSRLRFFSEINSLMRLTSDIFLSVQLVKSKSQPTQQLGFQKMLGRTSISSFMECQLHLNPLKALMSISFRKQMNLSLFMILSKLMRNRILSIGSKNLLLLKKLSSLKLLEQIR